MTKNNPAKLDPTPSHGLMVIVNSASEGDEYFWVDTYSDLVRGRKPNLDDIVDWLFENPYDAVRLKHMYRLGELEVTTE